MRTSSFASNAAGVALVVLLAGCAGGSAQTPASSGASSPLGANSLGASSLDARLPGTNLFGEKPAQNANHGFMQSVPAGTNLMYMTSWGTASVVEVMTTSGELVGQIANGLAVPQGIFTDTSGNLWVANENNVLVYPHGGLSPSATLSDPVGPTSDVTVCPNGTAYVADFYNNSDTNVASVQVYPPGATSPSASLTYQSDVRNPYLTCDAAGNVFVAILSGQSIGSGRVIEFPLGQQSGVKDLGITLQDPGGIKPDNAGNLLVTDLVGNTITEYTESGVPTGKSIAAGTTIGDIALSRNGKTVFGANLDGPSGIAWSFPAGKQQRVYTCCSRIGPPLQNLYGVAMYPGQAGI